jgi:hypothetical protein
MFVKTWSARANFYEPNVAASVHGGLCKSKSNYPVFPLNTLVRILLCQEPYGYWFVAWHCLAGKRGAPLGRGAKLEVVPHLGKHAAIFLLPTVGSFVRTAEIFQTADEFNAVAIGIDYLRPNQIAGAV